MQNRQKTWLLLSILSSFALNSMAASNELDLTRHNIARACGGFEIGPGQPPDLRPASGWKCAPQNGKAILDKEVFHSGAHSLRLEPNAGKDFTAMTWVNMPGGKKYECSLSFRGEGFAEGGKLVFGANDYKGKSEKFQVCEGKDPQLSDGQWHRFSVTFEPSKEAASPMLFVNINGNGKLWVDDLSVAPLPYEMALYGDVRLPFSKELYRPVQPLHLMWKFCVDRENAGEKELWNARDLDESKWDEIKAGDFWDSSIGKYLGIAWYRDRFRLNPNMKGRRLGLYFGAVDESAWVYLNGKLIGAHGIEDDLKWDEPFILDISEVLDYEGENVVAVRVLNRSAAGGIWKPVAIVEASGRAQLGNLLGEITKRNANRTRRNPPRAPVDKSAVERPREVLFSIGKQDGSSADLKETSLPAWLEPRHSANVKFPLKKPGNVAIKLRFTDAAFEGARIEVEINGRELVPYLAFGGDTRFQNCRGKEGLDPPVGEIEANYVIPSAWISDENRIVIRNAGPGGVELDCLEIAMVAADNLPRLKNPLYIDFSVWTQGYPYKSPYEKWRQDWLLGIAPGNGVAKPAYEFAQGYNPKYEHPPSECHLWKAKEDLEQTKLGWGYKLGRFYGYSFIGRYQDAWAIYIDADNNPATQNHRYGKIKPGTDIIEWDPQRYAALFEPHIAALAEYLDMLTLGLEWNGHVNISGYDLDGLNFYQFGFSPYRWAENFDEATEAVKTMLGRYAPSAKVESQSCWGYPEDLHFQHARERNRWMADSIDIISTHGWGPHSYAPWDYGPDNWPVFTNVNLSRRYPGADFGGESEQVSIEFGMDGTRHRSANFVPIPEVALDFNRYRLGRTEKDLIVKPKEKFRWVNGEPFNFDAGFDGDEWSYNSETSGFGGYYFEPSNPYWFLRSIFAYCLLPAAASEEKKLRIAQRPALQELEQIPVNMYGEWVADGVNHTQRFKTRDPLYGDMFGYSGFQFCVAGDYIGYGGLSDRYHRRPSADAFGLARRTMNAFATSAQVYPAQLMNTDSRELIIKAMLEPMDFERVITIRAANFDSRAHQLDVMIPLGWKEPARVLVFDERSAFWHDGKSVAMTPESDGLRITAAVAPLGTRLYAIFPPKGKALCFLGGPDVPDIVGPSELESVEKEPVVLEWTPVDRAAQYHVQLASEATFRKGVILEEKTVVRDTRLEWNGLPGAKKRYFWRVQAEDCDGRMSGFSSPFSFVFQWPEYAKWRKKNQAELQSWKSKGEKERSEESELARKYGLLDENPIFNGAAYYGLSYWKAPEDACDMDLNTNWSAGGKTPMFAHRPLYWETCWAKPVEIREVRILWDAKSLGKAFNIQVQEDKDQASWQTALEVRKVDEPWSTYRLPKSYQARGFRLEFPDAHTGAIREMRVY